MHGDLGRSIPNLGEIMGCEVDIIALDVEVRENNLPYSILPKFVPVAETIFMIRFLAINGK